MFLVLNASQTCGFMLFTKIGIILLIISWSILCLFPFPLFFFSVFLLCNLPQCLQPTGPRPGHGSRPPFALSVMGHWEKPRGPFLSFRDSDECIKPLEVVLEFTDAFKISINFFLCKSFDQLVYLWDSWLIGVFSFRLFLVCNTSVFLCRSFCPEIV